MIVKLLTEHHLEFLSLKGNCRGSSESTHVKMPHCWKSHATAQLTSFMRMAINLTVAAAALLSKAVILLLLVHCLLLLQLCVGFMFRLVL